MYGIDSIGDHVYKIPGLGYTGPKGATRFVNELRQQVNELTTETLVDMLNNYK